jgi:signal transduction histidine kinase
MKEVEIRNKIASDLHDDVGSTLSSIRMYSDIVKHQPNQTETSTQLLDKISTNSKEMIENMSDIVWMIKPGNDEFVNIENRMLNFANELCVPAGINFEFNKNTSADDIKIPMEIRRDIYLIFKEAVNNAVKYYGCKNIRVNISLMQNQLHIRIEDDGNGFNIDAEKKGNGLSNMQKRTDDNKGIFKIISSVGEGTEILVSFKT